MRIFVNKKKKKVKTTVVCDGIDALKKEMNPNTNS